MSRWALTSMIWSGLTKQTARDRFSYRVCSTKTCRPSYDVVTPAPYRLKSRVSVYDKASTTYHPSSSRNNCYYNSPVYPSYHTTSGGYGGYSTSSRRSYETANRFVYRAAPAPVPAPPKQYYTPVRDAYDYGKSRRRSSSGCSSSSRPIKTVHWDDETFNNEQNDWDRRYNRHGDHNYCNGHITGMHGSLPRVTASGDSYNYTAAASNRASCYYEDDADRRSRKEYRDPYKSRSSRRSRC